jgi:hypothetical protein
VLGDNSVPASQNKFVQKILINRPSRSLVMFQGNPHKQKTSLKTRSATSAA